jgi:ATP-dependent protease ClpP protease subunit
MRDFKVEDIRPKPSPAQSNGGDIRAGGWYGFGGEFPISYTPMRSGIFNIYLFGEIEDASQFIPAIEVLDQASENDEVVIHLSTPGGSVDATDTFINAMRGTEAHVVARATGGVHSAGTIILLNAPEFILSENFHCLIHNGSTGAWGKFSDYKAQVKHQEGFMENVLRKTYAGFLTDAEIEALIEGKDFWFNAAEFGQRHERRNVIMQAQIATLQGQIMEQMALMQAGKPELEAPAPKKSRKKRPVEA